MQRTRKAFSDQVRTAGSTAPIATGQSAGLSPGLKPSQNCAGSFTCCEDCGLPISRETSDSDTAAPLDFFLTLGRWDGEVHGETVSVSTWERFS
jgi:hypothetical protein